MHAILGYRSQDWSVLSAELFEVSSVVMFKLQFNHMVAQEIESEAKYEKDFLETLQMTVMKAQAGVKKNLRKLNKSIIKNDLVEEMDIPFCPVDPTMHLGDSCQIGLPSSDVRTDPLRRALTIL
ncbi:LOW QUALITY PROTEIN: hypothetical protein NC653_006075 [Populus alba x Populus x berolinensis]|uniref:Uncharacterized protein n=1 Tax=Populus alba x Populus x berolinensis TaxID=444605 RepID=A0AAD6RDW5_9ROSI|nr:LOW QUALITY PROTEIN: hypothetical protein NC653_006075 [Populus alba x Populus x berolinensis]